MLRRDAVLAAGRELRTRFTSGVALPAGRRMARGVRAGERSGDGGPRAASEIRAAGVGPRARYSPPAPPGHAPWPRSRAGPILSRFYGAGLWKTAQGSASWGAS